MKLSKAMRDTLVEALLILVGEAICSAIVSLIFFAFGSLDLSVFLGSLLGIAVVLANYLILAISVNRAVDRYLEKRGSEDMTEEEASAFAAKNSASVSLAAGGTYVLRMLLMLGVLVGAFLLKGVFNVIATLVPLVAYRPVIFVIELVRSKIKKKKGEVE